MYVRVSERGCVYACVHVCQYVIMHACVQHIHYMHICAKLWTMAIHMHTQTNRHTHIPALRKVESDEEEFGSRGWSVQGSGLSIGPAWLQVREQNVKGALQYTNRAYRWCTNNKYCTILSCISRAICTKEHMLV